MAVGFRAALGSSNASLTTTSATVAIPTGTAVGDLAFIFIECSNADVTYTGASGWTKLLQYSNFLNTNLCGAIYYRTIQAGDTTPNVLFTDGVGAGGKAAWAMVVFSPGAGGTLVLDNATDGGAHTDVGTSKPVNAVGASASSVASVIFIGLRENIDSSTRESSTPPAGWTEAVDVSTAVGVTTAARQIGVSVDYALGQSGTVAPGNVTAGRDASASIWHITIAEAGGGGGGSTVAGTAALTTSVTLTPSGVYQGFIGQSLTTPAGLTAVPNQPVGVASLTTVAAMTSSVVQLQPGTAALATAAALNVAASTVPVQAAQLTTRVTLRSDGYWRGVGSAGGEFGTGNVPGTYDVDYHYDRAASLTYLGGRGQKLARIAFLWERLQRTLSGPLDAGELGRLLTYCDNARAAGLSVILDVHNYARYGNAALGSPGGPAQADLVDFWTRVGSSSLGSHPAVIAYGLMNEPHDLPSTWTAASLLQGFETGGGGWTVEGESAVVDRSTLVIGVNQPNAETTGTIPGTTLTVQSGDVTLSTAGQTFQNIDLAGKITVTAANVTIKNCRIRGFSPPGSTDTFLIKATGAGVSNLLIQDCELRPDTPAYNWDSAITGHDFTARRCNIYYCVDGINVFNTNVATPYASNVVIEQCWIHDLGWWTAATGGVVHPSDTKTHNDAIQIQGGTGTIIRGNRIDGAYARQYAHWVVTNPAVEPYTQVAFGSLSDGGPFQALPDRGSGTSATGRYNLTNLSGIQMGQNVGDAVSFTVTDNWFYGGYIPINAASLVRHAGQNMGSWLRNKFDRSAGATGFSFYFNSSWAGFITTGAGTADANTYLDTGAEVNFRVTA